MGETARWSWLRVAGALPSPPQWPAPLPFGWVTLRPRAARPAISTSSFTAVLQRTGFSGTIEASLQARPGRPAA
jgi:hypothetical protein